tara:strand:- start:2357 stop:3403 length:1047 start_codon:yes stop_codon:yes gene_type:complete
MKIALKNFLYCSFLILMSTSLWSVNDSKVTGKEFPEKLSEFNFFTDQKNQIPSKDVHPYELITSLFSDYSYKSRFLYVPQGKKALYQQDWVFDFPVGSALIKTFYFPIDERNLALGSKLLETRVLLHKETGWEAVSYAWNNEQTEAYLKIAGKTINTSWINHDGQNREVRYRVPNKNQCKECHSTNEVISPIGPKARNLDKDFIYFDETKNQLTYLYEKGVINSIPKGFKKVSDWEDEAESLEGRARAYLAINCGHCHMPSGVANSTGLYLNLSETRSINLGINKSPVATGRGSGNLKYSIVPGKSEKSILLFRMISTDPGVMMPESGRSLVHKEAVLLIEEWINSMK